MARKKQQQKKFATKYLPTKFMLTARLLVGGYLIYTSYQLIDGVVNGEGRDSYFLGAFMIAFAIIGILLMYFAGRDLLGGKYVGGELDAGEEEEQEAVETVARELPESGAEEAAAKTDIDKE